MPGTRKLGRTTAHRKSMLRGMVTLLLDKGQIETTLSRAKEVRPMAEKMITLGKKNTLATRRAAMAYITKEDIVKKLFDVIAPKYEKVNGGYTQLYKLGPRRGDAAEMAIIRLTETEADRQAKAAAAKNASKKKAAKKEEASKEDTAVKTEAPAESKAEEKTEEKKPTAKKTTAAKKPAAAKKAEGEAKPAAKKAAKKPDEKAE